MIPRGATNGALLALSRPDRARGQRADTNSIYHWASITRPSPRSRSCSSATAAGSSSTTWGGARFIGHTGSQAGFRSFFYLNPATLAAVVVVFNTTNDARPEPGDAGFRALRESALELIRD